MMTNVSVESYILGKAPLHVGKKDILPYFLYAYELTWSMPMFIEKKDSMISYLELEVKKEYLEINDLCLEKRWWLYVLIAMRDISIYHRIEFSVQTINHIIRNIFKISEKSLCNYINSIHSIMVEEIPDVLQIRPNEVKTLGNSLVDTDDSLQFFLEKKDIIIKVFKKHLIQRDLNKEYYDTIFMKDRRILRKFSDVWNAFFELFVHFFITVYDYKLSPKNMKLEKLEKAIEDLILVFVVSSIANKEKIDAFHIELSEIVKEISKVSSK
jgi:hypothetical protein